jgi:hypothetical protein
MQSNLASRRFVYLSSEEREGNRSIFHLGPPHRNDDPGDRLLSANMMMGSDWESPNRRLRPRSTLFCRIARDFSRTSQRPCPNGRWRYFSRTNANTAIAVEQINCMDHCLCTAGVHRKIVSLNRNQGSGKVCNNAFISVMELVEDLWHEDIVMYNGLK